MKYKLTKFIKKKDFVRLISIAIFLLGIILVVWISSFYMPFVKQPVKIGSTYMTLNNNFYKTINEEVKKQVSQNGDILYTRDPGLSVSKQCQQIYDFIDKNSKPGIKRGIISHRFVFGTPISDLNFHT